MLGFRSIVRAIFGLSSALVLASTSSAAPAADGADPYTWSGWSVGIAPYTYHFSDAKKEHAWEPDSEKHSYVWLMNAEKHLDNQQVAGLALFSNSFGQFSQYMYVGREFHPLAATPQLFFKLTGGVIHGYKYPYHKKIPLNNKHGWGLTAIPAVGWNMSENWGGQVNLLGKSAVMFQLNYAIR